MRTLLVLFVGLSLGCGAGTASHTAVAGVPGLTGAPETSTAAAVVPPAEIDVAGLDALPDDILLVDVRTPGEYAGGHAPGAVNIPLDELPQRLGELESHKDEAIYLICRSGARSGKAAQLLSAQGFQATNVVGGTLAWQAAGYPVEQ